MPIEPLAPISHPWGMPAAEAIALQRRLAPLVAAAPPIALENVRVVAGVDVSYDDTVGEAYAAVVVYSYPALERLAETALTRPCAFPYVPGLLSFREAPVAVEALAALSTRPDLLLCDGQGIAHPRRFGLACHLGALTGLPSVGCAKSRLVGSCDEPGRAMGDHTPLRAGGDVIGAVLRTRPSARPLFISPGYRVTLEQALEVTLRCLRGRRLPEPTRAADSLAAATRRARPTRARSSE
ncbi:MAG TPA: deoxyribonuclease V [Ktedonobacterales bacterium]|nr:deoxyribonuclease V [Ktedonobacterales bacterium]